MTTSSPVALTTAEHIASLRNNGFALIPQALDSASAQQLYDMLYGHYLAEDQDGLNEVGNMFWNHFLRDEYELVSPLIAHPSVAPCLQDALGKQCQLRSLRAHMNPQNYTQEWHMDFPGYWKQANESAGFLQQTATCMNTTFYLTDNTAETGRLTFIKDFLAKDLGPEMCTQYKEFWPECDRNDSFQSWCEQQELVHLHPQAGDVIVFLSHLPHQGAKLSEQEGERIRSNVVVHYQQNAMHPDLGFVSDPNLALQELGYEGTFPFC